MSAVEAWTPAGAVTVTGEGPARRALHRGPDGGRVDPERAEPARRPEGPRWGADVVRPRPVRRLLAALDQQPPGEGLVGSDAVIGVGRQGGHGPVI
jgi:hypothetical protein